MKPAPTVSKQARRKAVNAVIRCVTDSAEITAFGDQLDEQHYLGSTPPVGDFLHQIVERDYRPLALLVWGAAALKLKEREAWIGWSVSQRGERLKLVVQNRRFLLLHDKGKEPDLPSQTLALACRELPAQWREHFRLRGPAGGDVRRFRSLGRHLLQGQRLGGRRSKSGTQSSPGRLLRTQPAPQAAMDEGTRS